MVFKFPCSRALDQGSKTRLDRDRIGRVGSVLALPIRAGVTQPVPARAEPSPIRRRSGQIGAIRAQRLVFELAVSSRWGALPNGQKRLLLAFGGLGVMAAEGGAAPAPQSSSNPPSADPAWAHGTVVDMARRKVQCKYCNWVLSGGVWRLKQHLMGIKGENNFVGHRKQVECLLRKRTISDVLVIT
ncbi:hypothetical protein Taro_042786 [Colocasia esculenta]|uniref:BED-type domain-containing protein n=1 Tax=Colocasia esculenta TaxID=4460 RepID=A0A843X084_COLES|nr:hypothetical protein [Colocasia esculenta]